MASSSVTKTPRAQSQPLAERKSDIAWIAVLVLTLMPAFAFDFAPYYPAFFPTWTKASHQWYMKTYKDPLYYNDPTYMHTYTILEFFYIVPASLWAIWGLIYDDKTAILNLLALATHVISSTIVTLVAVWTWPEWPAEEISKVIPGVGAVVCHFRQVEGCVDDEAEDELKSSSSRHVGKKHWVRMDLELDNS